MQITWTDKSNLDTLSSVPRANKVIDDDLNEIKTVVNTNDGLLSNVTGHILWTNENPTSPITTDTNITLADDDYDIYEIIYSYNTTNDFQQSVKALKGKGTILLITYNNNTSYRRIINYVDDTTLTIKAQEQSQNQFAIPEYIIGYKTGLF